MIINRTWAMPNSETFKIKPIREFVDKYLKNSKCSVDPFARNSKLATYTNDLNTETNADYNLDAEDFLKLLIEKNIKCDLLIFDWPYSPRQIKECYNSIGRKMQMKDGQSCRLKKIWKETSLPLLNKDSIVLTFGWNTVGMGKKLGFKIEEILLCCCGGGHNDIICVAERKL